jgi:hypothetical protein
MHLEEGMILSAIAGLTAEQAERNSLFPFIYGLTISPSNEKGIRSNVVRIDELLS